jgi:hypothetical protein
MKDELNSEVELNGLRGNLLYAAGDEIAAEQNLLSTARLGQNRTQELLHPHCELRPTSID